MAMVFLAGISRAQEVTTLSMADAERIALQNHPSVRSAEAAVSASRGRFWRGFSPPMPEISLEQSYIPLHRPLSAFGEKTWEVHQSVEFPLTTVTRGIGLAHEVRGQENDLASARQEVAANAKLAYVFALASEQRLALATENLAIADSFLHDARIRKNVGEGTQLELLTAQVQRTQTANTVESARASLVTTQDELRNALGWPPGHSLQNVTLSDSLGYRPLTLDLDSLQALARKRSPRIAAFEDRVSASEAARTAAWMSVLPSLDFSYYRQTVGNDPNLYGVRFGISLPLWFLFDTRGQVQEAAAGARIASESLRSAESMVSLEVASAFTAYANSKRQVELERQEILPQAEEIFRVASISYVAGEASYVEFLQAQQALNAARNATLEALVDYNRAIIRLENAVGGLP